MVAQATTSSRVAAAAERPDQMARVPQGRVQASAALAANGTAGGAFGAGGGGTDESGGGYIGGNGNAGVIIIQYTSSLSAAKSRGFVIG